MDFFAPKRLKLAFFKNGSFSFTKSGHSDNRLTSLPEQLFQRTSLEIFRASHNDLHEIPVKTLNPVQSTLKHLDLTGNKITTISDSQLNQIQSLVVLNLAHNLITTIDHQAFCCLPNLSSLDLSFNPLKRVDADTFAGTFLAIFCHFGFKS